MATLVSPGVSISLIDQTLNVGAGPGTVPLIFIATQSNKVDPTGQNVLAPGTIPANAGKVWSITSQSELVSTFGDPTFYSVSGTPINAYPLNEYGLLATYSYLGLSNLALVVRADIDLSELEATPVTPSSPAAVGTYWLNEGALPTGSAYGLFVQTGTYPNAIWVAVTPQFVYNFATGVTTTPTSSDGVIGNYAVVFQAATGQLSYWVKIGTATWNQIGTTAYTSASLSASSVGTVVTVPSTANLAVGMIPIVTAGSGAFAPNTTITAVTPTSFTVSAAPTAPLGDGTYFTFSNSIASLGALTIGGSYLPNIYENVPLTGGTGTGATATINVNGAGSVGGVINNAGVVITNPGTGYTAGDVLSATTQTGVFSTTGLGSGFSIVVGTTTSATVTTGAIATGTLAWSGLNYLPGSYTSYTGPINLIGGHGTGAQADIVVNGATNVSSVIITNPGSGYAVGDILTVTPATLGVPVNNPGSGLQSGGFEWVVDTITPSGGSPATVTASFGVTIQSVWPDLTNPATTQEFWIKTTSAAQGANLVLDEMNATTSTFVQVEAPILANDASANIYYSTEAAGSAGRVYIEPVISGIGASSVNTFEFRYGVTSSTWVPLETIIGSSTVPVQGPANGQLWFNGLLGLNSQGQSTIDILVADNVGAWQNINLPGFSGMTVLPGSITLYPQSGDPRANIPAPTLIKGDIWVQTDVEPYPTIYRWSGSAWVLVNLTDQTTPNGIIFDDARPNPLYHNGAYSGENNEGGTNPDLDPDAPQAALYPPGFLLWNTRYSSNNVKVWESPYVYNGVTASPDNTNNGSTGRWVNNSGNNADGQPFMGADAQQQVIVKAVLSQMESNQNILAEDLFFNLIAAPSFVECITGMITINTARDFTAFIVGDSPMTLAATGTSLQNWATNSALALTDGPNGLVSTNSYLGVWYPSGLSTNTDGSSVVVPPSHMALSTIAYNDQVAYPWFAPAGLQRGVVNNATDVGYVNAQGQFISTQLNQGQRDILYTNGVNPIRIMPSGGIVIFGQKDRQNYSSALDRINVARLINYLNYQFNQLAIPFLFEPNDKTTQHAVLAAFNSFLSELVTLRALYDFLVVCDSSNNTPARVEANQLWIDVAIQPEIAIEFIYIPIRLVNTGASLTASTSTP